MITPDQSFNAIRPGMQRLSVLARIVFTLCLLTITLNSLATGSGIQGIAHLDKIAHFVAYFILSGLAVLSWPKRSRVMTGLFIFAYSLVIEAVQALFITGRTGSLLDGAANGMGVICGIAVAALMINQRFGRKSVSDLDSFRV